MKQTNKHTNKLCQAPSKNERESGKRDRRKF